MRFRSPALLAALLLASTSSVFGLGIRVADQNAAAVARGNAFTATADNPSAIYYNPAGITQLDGLQLAVGAYLVSFNARVDLEAPGDSFDNKYEPQAAPQFFATWKPEHSRFTLGLGMYAPFGFSIEYPDDAAFRTLARKGAIKFIALNPVVAFELTKTLSIAVGGTANYGKAELEQGVIAPGDKFRFEGDDTTFGFNAGIRWQPHPMHAFGVTYRSATEMEFQGHSELRTRRTDTMPGVDRREAAHVDYQFPQTVTAGYSFRPTPDWNFEVNIDWTDWDSLNTLTLHQRRSEDVVLPFNWESSFMYQFGATRKLGDFRVSAGYFFSENSVPNESFSPLVPDSNRHIFSVGVGQETKHFSWDLAYQYVHGPSRTIEKGSLADGTYRFESHALTFTLGYRF